MKIKTFGIKSEGCMITFPLRDKERSISKLETNFRIENERELGC